MLEIVNDWKWRFDNLYINIENLKLLKLRKIELDRWKFSHYKIKVKKINEITDSITVLKFLLLKINDIKTVKNRNIEDELKSW